MNEDHSPPAGFPVADAIEARGAVVDFWSALAADNDEATRRLFYGPSMIRNGMTPDGLAGQLRERMGLTRDQCKSMGISTTVRVLPDGAWAFLSKPTWRFELYDKPTLVIAQMWVVVRDTDGAWRLWGAPENEAVAGALLVQLPIDLAPQGTA